MDEIKVGDEYESAEIFCNDCTGNLIQVKQQIPQQRLFTPIFFVKWCYLCQKCGKQSKIFCSRTNNQIK